MKISARHRSSITNATGPDVPGSAVDSENIRLSERRAFPGVGLSPRYAARACAGRRGIGCAPTGSPDTVWIGRLMRGPIDPRADDEMREWSRERRARTVRAQRGCPAGVPRVGSGDTTLVLIPGWFSNVEMWDDPASPFTAVVEQLAEAMRVIVWDKRGTGLSDPATHVPPLDERMDDLHAVLDAARSRSSGPFWNV